MEEQVPPAGRAPRRTDTSDPRRSRSRALRILFEADVRGLDAVGVLERAASDPEALELLAEAEPRPGAPGRRVARAPVDGFTRRLVAGVAAERGELDRVIARHARRWTIARMPVVDRNVLRLGVYELLNEPTPAAVVIDEAVTLAKELSTADSGRWVNGVLEAVRRELGRD